MSDYMKLNSVIHKSNLRVVQPSKKTIISLWTIHHLYDLVSAVKASQVERIIELTTFTAIRRWYRRKCGHPKRSANSLRYFRQKFEVRRTVPNRPLHSARLVEKMRQHGRQAHVTWPLFISFWVSTRRFSVVSVQTTSHSHTQKRIKEARKGVTTWTSDQLWRYMNARTNHDVEVGDGHTEQDSIQIILL